MPIRHVVLFDFKPAADEAAIQDVISELNRLPGVIPEIKDWAIHQDHGKRDGSFRFALLATFDDLPAVDRYLNHPAHVKAVAGAKPILDRVAEHDHPA